MGLFDNKRRAFNEIGRYQDVQRHEVGSEVLKINMNLQLMHLIKVRNGEDAVIEVDIFEIEETCLFVIELGDFGSITFSDQFKFPDGCTPLFTNGGQDVISGVIFDDKILCSVGFNYV